MHDNVLVTLDDLRTEDVQRDLDEVRLITYRPNTIPLRRLCRRHAYSLAISRRGAFGLDLEGREISSTSDDVVDKERSVTMYDRYCGISMDW